MKTRMISLNHPAVTAAKLSGRKALHTLPDGTTVAGVLARASDGRGLVHLSGEGDCFRVVGPLVKLILEED